MTIAAVEPAESLLRECADATNRALASLLSRSQRAPAGLVEAMRYSVEIGGKRLRPALVLLSCRACDGDEQAALPAAAAIECVHTFSLVHDDLPAMDDDDLRRGRPTNHKVFGEGMAVLAGDGLLALAFEALAGCPLGADARIRLVDELARASGWEGMIGGQAEDLRGETLAPDRALVERIHDMKTARLIQCACRLGAIAAEADDAQFSALSRFGHEVGMAFQIADDLLDVTAETVALGKRSGKDAEAGKQTFPGVVGIEESRRLALAAVASAKDALRPFGRAGEPLAILADFVLQRTC